VTDLAAVCVNEHTVHSSRSLRYKAQISATAATFAFLLILKFVIRKMVPTLATSNK